MSSAEIGEQAGAEDWLDRLYEGDSGWSGPELLAVLVEDGEDQAEGRQADESGRGPWMQPHPGYYQSVQRAVVAQLLPSSAKPALSAGTRRLLYSASAAGAGYLLGLEPLLADVIAECGREASIGAALVIGLAVTGLIAHLWDRRTRHWWWGLAWAARIPLASAVTALALWAPASAI